MTRVSTSRASSIALQVDDLARLIASKTLSCVVQRGAEIEDRNIEERDPHHKGKPKATKLAREPHHKAKTTKAAVPRNAEVRDRDVEERDPHQKGKPKATKVALEPHHKT